MKKQPELIHQGGTWTGSVSDVMRIYYLIGRLKGMNMIIQEDKLDKTIEELEVLTNKLIPF